MLTADRFKLVVAALALVGGVAAFYYLGGRPDVVRLLALLAGVVVATAVALQTEVGRSGWEFAKGARLELRKVVWPSRKETTQMTLVVVVMVILVSLFLWIVDWSLGLAIQKLTG